MNLKIHIQAVNPFLLSSKKLSISYSFRCSRKRLFPHFHFALCWPKCYKLKKDSSFQLIPLKKTMNIWPVASSTVLDIKLIILWINMPRIITLSQKERYWRHILLLESKSHNQIFICNNIYIHGITPHFFVRQSKHTFYLSILLTEKSWLPWS
jgi:hypothetical protein